MLDFIQSRVKFHNRHHTTTGSYQLLDPTICAVLRAQEVLMGYVAQAIALHVVPYYLSFIGAGFVLSSAILTPLEKYVKPRLPEKLQSIC